ncbi:MAG: protein-L-isoaspartate(D-aspartate) O-methyltransferase [Gammaproteobacteria bacterium]|nr:MAG: protein-L-isoaspartate(D-aspartate) O-methyltransferase [Gammaproteobacteria bacterium]
MMNRQGIGMTSARTRERLIDQLKQSGISHPQVLDAIRNVPRHLFVEEALASRAYENTPLPIGHGQTISQPYIVARMTQALLEGSTPANVLEVGTGCGYQTAVLAEIFERVWSVERIEALHRATRLRLRQLGYHNIRLKLADGSWGWKEYAPYDAIMVTAACASVPQALFDQLAPGGVMLAPVGQWSEQALQRFTRTGEGVSGETLERVRFVPLVSGQA